MEKKNNVNEQVAVENKRYVIHNGIRMTYEEWLDMVKSERN